MVYMPKTYNEKMIWKILHENPKGIGKRDLERQSGVNSSSTQKILTKLSKLNEIDYPLPQRGKKSLIKISDVRNLQLFKKIKKFTKSIDDAWETYGEGIIFELKDGTTIQAGIDDVGDGELMVYDLYMLDGRKWKKNPWKKGMGFMEIFNLKDIKAIWSPDLKKLDFKSIDFETIRKLWIDPNYEPLHSIECHGGWRTGKPHSKNCDGDIHDTLVQLYTYASHAHFEKACKPLDDVDKSHELQNEFSDNFSNLITYILKLGGKIPGGNTSTKSGNMIY